LKGDAGSPYTIWQSENFSIAKSYDFPLPGYLFVECTSGAASMSELKAAELVELSHVLQRAESLIDSLSSLLGHPKLGPVVASSRFGLQMPSRNVA